MELQNMATKEEYQDLCRPPLQSSEECPCSAPEKHNL
jgi:hypothetical protein